MVSKLVTGGIPWVSLENADTTPTAPSSARIANTAQIARAIQPAADGEVRWGASRTSPRSARGASYTCRSGVGCRRKDATGWGAMQDRASGLEPTTT